jgi:hypothetical protein
MDVHQRVGLAHQLIARLPVLGVDGDAKAGGDRALGAFERLSQRSGQIAVQAFGDAARLATIEALHEDHELVAPVARDEITRPHRLLQSAGHGNQGTVAGSMTKVIVDLLESVEVDEDDREGLTATGGGVHGVAEGLSKPAARGEVSQLVAACCGQGAFQKGDPSAR